MSFAAFRSFRDPNRPPLRARHASLCGGTATGTDGDRAWPLVLWPKDKGPGGWLYPVLLGEAPQGDFRINALRGWLCGSSAAKKGVKNELPEIAMADDWGDVSYVARSWVRRSCSHAHAYCHRCHSYTTTHANPTDSNANPADSNANPADSNADANPADSNAHAYAADSYACATDSHTSPTDAHAHAADSYAHTNSTNTYTYIGLRAKSGFVDGGRRILYCD